MNVSNGNENDPVPAGVIAVAVNLLIDSDTSDSSDSEDDSDDDNFMGALYFVLTAGQLAQERQVQPRQRFIERGALSREDFRKHFCMYPETFKAVLAIIGPKLEEANNMLGRKALSADKLLLIALWFMATPDSYRSVASQFGVARSTAYTAVRRVSYALNYNAPAFIRWPRGEEATPTIRPFERKYGFPGVMGAIDGSHIQIRAQKDDHVAYINRKGVHSVVLQGVCDARSIFMHVYVGAPGSVHDARVFRTSSISDYQNMPEEYFPDDSHL